jgi:photosystem II stability/assembly factor-like uncharacterized protein
MPLILKSQSWQEISVPTENNLKDLYFFDENHGWIIGENGTILKYLLGGWVVIKSVYSDKNFNSLFFTDSIHGWIIGDNGVILKYFNDTIQTVSSPTNENLNDIYMIDANNGWIIGENKTILKYINNEWISYSTESYSNNVRDLNNIQFLDSTFGIIIGDYNRILIYEDHTWNEGEDQTNMVSNTGLYILDKENIFIYKYQIAVPPHGYPIGEFFKYNMVTNIPVELGYCERYDNVEIYITDSSCGWAIGNSAIYKFDGKSFIEFQIGDQSIILNSICFVNDSTGWIVGNNGYVLTYKPLLNSIKNKNNLQAIRAYPNPFQDQLYLTLNKPCTNIEIMELNGRILKKYNIKENELLINMDLSFLNNGIYILRMTGKDIEYKQKIIKE